MRLDTRRFGVLCGSTVALLLSCSGGEPGGGPGGSLPGGDDDDAAASGGGPGTPSGTGGAAPTSWGDDDGTSLTAGNGNSCAADVADSELTPLYLVFIYDTSGSMGDQTFIRDGVEEVIANRAYRWDPMEAGMVAFFNDPASNNVYASLEFFPAPGDFEGTCRVSNYSTPTVSLTPLTEPAALVSALEHREPQGGTPTLPALRGAVEYAISLKVDNPNAHVEVVLVTDGEPAVVMDDSDDYEVDPKCPADDSLENTVEGVAAVARAAYEGNPSIPVHVIGVGESLSALDQIADAGGKPPLTLITVDNPAETTAQLREKLQQIQIAQFSCDMDIPNPPNGQNFDKGLVNVSFAHSDGTVEEFKKSVGCTTGVGWQYDDETTPTTIELCQSTCNAIQNDPGGRLRTAFGCTTVVL